MEFNEPRITRITRIEVRVIRVIRGLFLPIFPEINNAMVTSQEVHESFVIRIRKTEEGQHLPIATARALEALSDEMFHMCTRDQPFCERSGDRIPKVSHDDVFDRVFLRGLMGQDDVIRIND